jgi:excisionase family DNA binding protein
MEREGVTGSKGDERERIAISIEATAWRLSVSPSFLRLEIRRGRLRPLRLGRRVLISESEISRYLAASASDEDRREPSRQR